MTRGSILLAAFWSALAAVLVLSLWPSSSPPPMSTGWDKSDHVVAYLVLGLLGFGAYGRRFGVWIALLAYGGAIELLQALSVYRTASWNDWLADAVGLALAFVVGSLARSARARRTGTR